MYQGKSICALLLMSGVGRRFGKDIPKQFLTLGGKAVYQHALDTFLEMGIFDEIILVTHPDWLHIPHDGARIVIGGNTRQESVFRGLQGLEKPFDIVLIHDGVRPFVSKRIVEESVTAAIRWGAANTCIPSTDTLVYSPEGKVIKSIPKREEILRGQTPQTFRMDWILEAHEKARADQIENATDDCTLVLRIGHPIHIIPGEDYNMKITSEIDLVIAESCASNFYQRA